MCYDNTLTLLQRDNTFWQHRPGGFIFSLCPSAVVNSTEPIHQFFLFSLPRFADLLAGWSPSCKFDPCKWSEIVFFFIYFKKILQFSTHNSNLTSERRTFFWTISRCNLKSYNLERTKSKLFKNVIFITIQMRTVICQHQNNIKQLPKIC